MFDWDVLKHRIPESVQFYIGDLPMYIFLIPTHPYIRLLYKNTPYIDFVLLRHYSVSTSVLFIQPKYFTTKLSLASGAADFNR